MKSADRTKTATKKRGAARNEKGQFEPLSPYEDPELLDQLVRLVRAVRDIQPMIAATVLAFKQLDDKDSAQLASLVGHYLDTLKDQAVRSLSVDPESQKEAKKARIEAKRLGNLPLQEVQRIQQNAREWLLDVDVTPLQLMKASPQVLNALMPLFKATAIGVKPQEQHTPALPADKPQGGA
jgi:hypothetical protein